MIPDLDETIRQLLIEDMPIPNGDIEISFDQPKREWSSRLSRPTLNLYLFDVRENTTLRRHQHMVHSGANVLNGTIKQKRMPMRINCHYMLTAWASVPEDEHRLLSRAMMVLFRYRVLPKERLVSALQNQVFDVQTTLADPKELTRSSDVWSSLDNEMRPSVSYKVTLALDPWEAVEGPLVRSFEVRAGQAEGLPYRPTLRENSIAYDKVFIGGIVTNKKDVPQAGIEVAIRGTGFMTTTNEKGQFQMHGIDPGEYTLLAWAATGKPKSRKISIPAKDGDYNIKI